MKGAKLMIKLGSLFDGIGGWQIAALKCGITPIWSSEIEKFPQEVTARHFPHTKQLGDITEINGAEIEPVDIICMGSPCQDLSIAGKREGLSGERSGLFKTAINIIRDMRTATGGKYPRFVVWENVPGAFSSNRGHDFRTVLEEITESEIPMPASEKWATAGMARSDKCDIAWRVLDAQHWGVPQRRKRIFLVADFREQRAGEILFKPESMSGDFTPGGDKREGTAGNVTDSARTSSLGFDTKDSIANSMPVLTDKTPPLKTNNRLGVLTTTVPVVYDMTHANHVIRQVGGGVVQTLTARMGTGGNQVPIIQLASGKNATGCLLANCATKQWTGNQEAFSGDFHVIETYATDLIINNKVRRLTPTECERLQGLSSGYTEGGSDSARYKAIGNGMAQPCADYVIQGIAKILGGEK